MSDTISSPSVGQSRVQRLIEIGLSLFTVVIFVDSLRYKFTNHPNTQEIFSRLEGWADGFGAGGLFTQKGLFGAYAIGTAELFASLLLLAGIVPALRRVGAFGNLLALGIMSGAISFHLFTPLGIDPNNDGGGLFLAACAVWISNAVMVFLRRRELLSLVGR